MMERFGGRSEWTGRVGTRVLPTSMTLVDDPTLKDFQGQPLLGNYDVDDEGVKRRAVTLVENGILQEPADVPPARPRFSSLPMAMRARRIFPTRGRSAAICCSKPSDALKPADLQKKFIDACRDDGHQWCLEVKQMDNPALSSVHQEDFSDFIGGVAGGIASGERMPLLVYRVYVADGHEETGARRNHRRPDAALAAEHSRRWATMPRSSPTCRIPPTDSRERRSGRSAQRRAEFPSTVIAPSLLARRSGNPRFPWRAAPRAAGSRTAIEVAPGRRHRMICGRHAGSARLGRNALAHPPPEAYNSRRCLRPSNTRPAKRGWRRWARSVRPSCSCSSKVFLAVVDRQPGHSFRSAALDSGSGRRDHHLSLGARRRQAGRRAITSTATEKWRAFRRSSRPACCC